MGERLKYNVYPVPAVPELCYRVLYDALLHLPDDSFDESFDETDNQKLFSACKSRNEKQSLDAFDMDNGAVCAVYPAADVGHHCFVLAVLVFVLCQRVQLLSRCQKVRYSAVL